MDPPLTAAASFVPSEEDTIEIALLNPVRSVQVRETVPVIVAEKGCEEVEPYLLIVSILHVFKPTI